MLSLTATRDTSRKTTRATMYGSLRQNPDPSDVVCVENGTHPEKQSPRFEGDMYWPRWIQGERGTIQEGWCGMCTPGCWLPLDGAFQDDKDFKHGVNAATGRPFDEPKGVRRMEIDPKVWWRLCSTCEIGWSFWVPRKER
jgi:hypothetical protein